MAILGTENAHYKLQLKTSIRGKKQRSPFNCFHAIFLGGGGRGRNPHI